ELYRGRVGRARLHDRPDARPAKLVAAAQYRTSSSAGGNECLDGAGLRGCPEAQADQVVAGILGGKACSAAGQGGLKAARQTPAGRAHDAGLVVRWECKELGVNSPQNT